MKIEHSAYQVEHPAEMADWYCQHLGFSVKRSADTPAPVRFLADSGGQVMVEIYNNPTVTTPDYASMDPLLVHLAFVCDDIQGTIERLTQAGATLVGGPDNLPNGDCLAMLRDPWHFPIQLCQRGVPMV